jgi:large subunit ribosomal protein L29
MKFSETKDMSPVELASRGRSLRSDLFNLRMQQASAQLEKTARIRLLRRDIARVETRLNEIINKRLLITTTAAQKPR